MRHKLLNLLLLTIGLTSTILSAQTITEDFPPSRDNTLFQRDAGDLSNGAGEQLFFGQTGPNANNVLRRTVLAFNTANIPPGSTVMDAQLSITVNMVPPGAASFDATLHRLLSDWGEGTSDAPGAEGAGTSAAPNDATWLHTFFDTQFWGTPGGDFSVTPSATTSLNNFVGTFTFSSAQLIADVQDMVDNPANNFGWAILGDEGDLMNARRIASRENPQTQSQPVLSITYEPAEEPPEVPSPTAVPVLNSVSLLILAGLMMVTLLVVRLRGQ